MQSVTPAELFRYCKIDDDPEMQELAEELAEASETYLTRLGVPINDANQARFALCVKAMTLHELDHPGEEYPGGIKGKINDLRFNR